MGGVEWRDEGKQEDDRRMGKWRKWKCVEAVVLESASQRVEPWTQVRFPQDHADSF